MEAGSVEFADASTWFSTPIAARQRYQSFADAKRRAGAHWVRFVGQPAWTARSAAQARPWARYESLLNLVFSASPVTALCAYDERSVAREILAQAQHTHPHRGPRMDHAKSRLHRPRTIRLGALSRCPPRPLRELLRKRRV